MRKTFAIVVLGLLTLTLPALATVPATDGADHTSSPAGVSVRVDCPGTVVWDTGMTDDFTPPTGCSTAASAGCFIQAINDGAFPADGRRLADDFFGLGGDPITHVKLWHRFNADGYDYYLANTGSIHGFCVKFYCPGEANFWCPDGTVAGEDAIGAICYDEYSDVFVVEEIFGGLIRNFNECVTLPLPFYADYGVPYWVSVSADFDFTTGPLGGVTQWFWRVYSGLGISVCEAEWWDTWNDPPTNWTPVSVAVNIPCWTGWDAAFVLYAGQVTDPTGACCFADQVCNVMTRADCDGQGGMYMGDNVPCDPNPCPTPVRESRTWGQIRSDFR